MKTIFSFVGFVVVMILLASTGVMKGDACLSNVGCVGANGGGIKQKVLAAHRAGLTDVILPSRNGGDLDELPQSVLEAVRFHLVDHVDEALAVALEPAPAVIS